VVRHGLGPTPQPWALIGAGAATEVEAKLSSWESHLALFGFCVLASASYLAMKIYAGLMPHKCQALLVRIRSWMDVHTDQVIIFGSLILGSLAHREGHLRDRQLRVPEINEHLLQPVS
jgi:hypothetical protein